MKKKYYVLISNDDGIRSEGLKALHDAVSSIAEVLVVAPDAQRSGASHSISVDDLLKARKAPYYGSKGYAISGTPADCAKLGLLRLAKRKPDLVLSGINHGPNMAQFILYSGTVGAAAEAALLGIPAMAFSIDTYEPKDFSFAVKYIRKTALAVLSGRVRIKSHTLLNVNIPDKKECDIKGVKVIPKGFMEYGEKYVQKKKTRHGIYYYWHIIGKKIQRKKDLTDADALQKGYITITPLNFDLNDRKSFNEIKRLAAMQLSLKFNLK
jgi:5'-nucleotidase